jgi:lysophospholipase L1-like esterase
LEFPKLSDLVVSVYVPSEETDSTTHWAGLVDFDLATRDASNTDRLGADYNLNDHLHPNDAGYKAMADAVDLTIFTK